MEEKKFGLSVRALIDDGDGKLLLIKRSQQSKFFRGLWEVPGGKVKVGETFDQALFREVDEETKLVIALEGVAGVTEYQIETKNIWVVALYMKARLLSKKPRKSNRQKWLPLSEFEHYQHKLTPSMKNMLPWLLKRNYT